MNSVAGRGPVTSSRVIQPSARPSRAKTLAGKIGGHHVPDRSDGRAFDHRQAADAGLTLKNLKDVGGQPRRRQYPQLQHCPSVSDAASDQVLGLRKCRRHERKETVNGASCAGPTYLASSAAARCRTEAGLSWMLRPMSW